MAGSKWLGSFGVYALITLALAGLSIWHAFHTRKQFFTATIYLTTNKIDVVVLSNVVFMLTLSLGRLIKYVFLGELSGQEITELERKGRIAVTETCLALTTFREELNIRMVALFTVLLFVKMFHWLAQMRIESVSVRTLSYGTHVRLSFLTLLLAASDVLFVTLITYSMLKQKGPSVLLLFAFEFMMLTVVIMVTAAKYLLYVQFRASSSQEGRTGDGIGRCCHKHAWMFYLDFTADLLRLFLLLAFFIIICAYYGLPIHLIREVWVTLYGLRERIIKFVRYRRLLRVLEHFPAASSDEMADIHCTICLDSMHSGVKLPCTHVFHKHCLYTWLFNSQRCPNCVREIPTDMARINPGNDNVQRNTAPVSDGTSDEKRSTADTKSVPNESLPNSLFDGMGPASAIGRSDFVGQDFHLKHERKAGIGTTQLKNDSLENLSGQPYFLQGGLPGDGKIIEDMLKMCQEQTHLLQSHVDSLQDKLADALDKLQKQLSYQEWLLRYQEAQKMAKRPNKEKTTDIPQDDSDMKHESKKEKEDDSLSKNSQMFRTISETHRKSSTAKDGAGMPLAQPNIPGAKKSEQKLPRENSRPSISRETSTPLEVREARIKFLKKKGNKGEKDQKKK